MNAVINQLKQTVVIERFPDKLEHGIITLGGVFIWCSHQIAGWQLCEGEKKDPHLE